MQEQTIFPLEPQVFCTQSGMMYFDKLPVGYRKAKLSDFQVQGKRPIGMRFLIQWTTNEDVYQICTVSNTLTSKILNPHLADERVFVKQEVTEDI